MPWKPIFASFRRIKWGGMIPGVSLRYTPGYEPLASLGRSTFQVVLRLFAAVIGCEGIQPERLNAEGFSPSALSRGLSVSATPGMPSSSRKASERRENSRQGSRFSRSSHLGGRYDTEGYASLHPRLRATRFARAFDPSGRAAVIGCGKLVKFFEKRKSMSRNRYEACLPYNYEKFIMLN